MLFKVFLVFGFEKAILDEEYSLELERLQLERSATTEKTPLQQRPLCLELYYCGSSVAIFAGGEMGNMCVVADGCIVL